MTMNGVPTSKRRETGKPRLSKYILLLSSNGVFLWAILYGSHKSKREKQQGVCCFSVNYLLIDESEPYSQFFLKGFSPDGPTYTPGESGAS